MGHMLGTVLRPTGVFLAADAPVPPAGVEIELWGHECCPYSRLMRETLCTWQLPYSWHCQAWDATPRIKISSPAMPEAMEISRPTTLLPALRYLRNTPEGGEPGQLWRCAPPARGPPDAPG